MKLYMLSKTALERIRQSKKCRIALQYAMNKTDATIYRWLDENNIILTTVAALQIIREETGLTDDEILEQTPAA